MATVNLGSIRFNWKGAYNNSTAYVVNDVVTSSGNSYVCIQASQGNAVGNATAYWNIMSSAGTNGTNGTDLSTTLNNNEIAFKTNAGALDGIAIGTAGQALKVNSGANGYEFGSAGKATELHVMADESTGNVSSSGNFVNWNFTPTVSGKVFLSHVGAHRAQSSSHYYCQYYFNNGSGEVEQHEQGFGFAPSQSSHNQGWGVSFIATTNSNADSTTPMTVTANTQCNFRVKNNSGDGSSAGGDAGKDHIVSALVFET
jgi:hypothetical protein